LRKLDRFKKYVLNSAEVAVLSHVNADPDAVSSMISMKELLKALKKEVNVKQIAPEGVSKASSQLLSTFKERFNTDATLSEVDLIILVDTSSPILLGGLEESFKTFKGKMVVVDHHNPSPDLPKRSLRFIDEGAYSACELVLSLYNGLSVKPSRKVARLLLTGMMFDTGHFTMGRLKTFEAAVQLLKLGAEVEESMNLLQFKLERPEKLARLKAASRCRLYDADGWIIAFSEVGSYQASAARSLIAVGADLAVVCGVAEGELRVNLRATKAFTDACGHLGRDIAEPMGKLLGGSGGGHETAAGVNVKGWMGDPCKALEALAHALKSLQTPLSLKEVKVD